MSTLHWRYDPVQVEKEAYWRAAFDRHPGNFFVGTQIYRILKLLDRDEEAERFCYGSEEMSGEQIHRYYLDRSSFEIIEAPDERPDDLNALLFRGGHYQSRGEADKALRDFSRAVELRPYSGQVRAIRASLLATAEIGSIRNGDQALSDAQAGLSLAATEGLLRGDWIHWRFLEVLAAAFAGVGDYVAAAEVLDLPMRQARSRKFLTYYGRLIAGYRAGHHTDYKQNIMPLRMLSSASPIPDAWFEE